MALSSIQDDLHMALERCVQPSPDEVIRIPNYIIDYTLLELINRDKGVILKQLLQRDPWLSKAFVYKESLGKKEGQMTKSVEVATLLGHAFVQMSFRCMEVLLEAGADPYVNAYLVTVIEPGSGEPRYCATLTPALSCLARRFVTEEPRVYVRLLTLLKRFDVELTRIMPFQRNVIEPHKEFQSHCLSADFLKHILTELESVRPDNLEAMSTFFRDILQTYAETLPDEPLPFDV